LAERITTAGQKKSNFFEILAFTGGLWFFLSQLVIGPLSRKFFSAPVEEILEPRQSIASSNAGFVEGESPVVDTSGHASA